MRLNTDGSDGLIVLKQKDYRNCDILRFDLSYVGTIRYTIESTKELRVKITKDLKSIFLNNDDDNILW